MSSPMLHRLCVEQFYKTFFSIITAGLAVGLAIGLTIGLRIKACSATTMTTTTAMTTAMTTTFPNYFFRVSENTGGTRTTVTENGFKCARLDSGKFKLSVYLVLKAFEYARQGPMVLTKSSITPRQQLRSIGCCISLVHHMIQIGCGVFWRSKDCFCQIRIRFVVIPIVHIIDFIPPA